MPKAEPNILAVLQSFVGEVDGVQVHFQKGDLVDADYEAATKWPAMFGPAQVRFSSKPAKPEPKVEQATAAPGEKRGR